MTTTASIDPPPDAALVCPLCDYNLRGLTEPRCPECGFAFSWAELLDERRDRHRWLFEHGRRRNVRTFVSTYFRDALPRRFWRAVTPANRVHVGRLLVYWVLTAVLAVGLTGGAGPVVWVVGVARENLASRAAYWPVRGQPGLVQLRGTGAVIPTRRLDADWPAPWMAGFWSEVRRDLQGAYTMRGHYDGVPSQMTITAVVLAWPWLTLAALLVFQASMRRAKVNSAHVLRVAVYGCDFGLLCAAVLAGYHALLHWEPFYQWLVWDRVTLALLNASTFPVLAVAVTCWAATTYRVAIAYGRYLRFDRPARTVLAAQAMVLLAVVVAVLRWGQIT